MTSPPTTPRPGSDGLADWRRELMELGGPNTLIWPSRSEDVIDLTSAHPGGIAMLLAGRATRLSDVVREPESLLRAERQARRLAAHTRQIRREHGVDTCFLTMGAATWEVPGQDERPVAPVLLRRARLRRLRGSGDHALDLAPRVELNPVLLTYLRRALRRDIDGQRLVALGSSPGGGFNPDPVFDALRAECVALPDLRIETQLRLAAHPYGKAEALADITAAMEREDLPPALRALATGEALPSPKPVTQSTAERAVIDLPLEQQAVLDRVHAGQDLCVHAPPETEPARLLAAVIADAAARGDRVLVLAERPAALRAIRTALEDVGLGGLLGLVGDPAAPVDSRVITERWTSDGAEPETKGAEPPSRRAAAAARLLSEHLHALRDVRAPWGVSAADAHDAVVELAAHRPAPRSRVRFDAARLDALGPQGRDDLAARLTSLADARAWRPEVTHEPWSGAHLSTDDDVTEVLAAVERLRAGALSDLRTAMREVFADIAEPRGTTPADHGRFLADIERVRDTLEVFRPEVFDTPLDPLLLATSASGGGLGGLERRRLRGQARALLRPGRPPADLHGALTTAAEQRRSWSRLTGGGGRPRIPADIDRAHRAYERVYTDLTHLQSVLADTEDGGELLTATWEDLDTRLARLARDEDGARLVPAVLEDIAAVRADGAGALLDDLITRKVTPPAVADEVRYVWWMSVLAQIAASDPSYGRVSGTDLDEALAAFVEADSASRTHAARRLAQDRRERFREVALARRHTSREVDDVLEGVEAAPSWGEVTGRWGALLHAAAPAWGVTPGVIGQVYGRAEHVDLVVVADAGRTTVARAAATIARGRQLLVVGDRDGLGPWTWTADAGVPAPARPSESLADVAAEVLPSVTLGEVRGARPGLAGRPTTSLPVPGGLAPPTLITVDGRATLDPDTALVETTAAEVEAVIEVVLDHLRQHADADGDVETIGVLTLSTRHAVAVSDALDAAVAAEPQLIDAASATHLVVRPAAAWHGDERDHLVVGVGYGRTPQGRLVTRLGELSGPDGPGFVALATSAARRRTTWVTTATAQELTGERAELPGPAALRAVLAELERATDADADASDGAAGALEDGPVAPLVESLARRLRARDVPVRTGVGEGSEAIDLVVGDPDRRGRWLLAVDVDGQLATDDATARAHHRHRGEALTELGWSYLRLWSIECYADPARQEARIMRALADAQGAG